MKKKSIKLINIIFIIWYPLFGVNLDSTFSLKWSNDAWGSGGLIPAGPPWSMVGPYDFDDDGFGDFIVASAYAGEFCNGVYHYEATGDDSIELKWVYTFYDLSCTYDAYSSVAVGDIDGDSKQEVLSLVDTSPGVLGQKGLQIFEWDTDSMSFLSNPSYTWDMGLDSVWEAAQIFVENIDSDPNQEIIVSIMDGPWSLLGVGGSSRLMIFELDTIINDSAIFHIEYEDNISTGWSGYNISVGDLDNDGLKEIYTVAYEYFHIIIHENTAEDTYEYQTDFYVTSEQYQRANQGIIIEDIDNDGSNELFCATSGVNSLSGDLITPGSFFIVDGVSDVSGLSYANFNLIANYTGGLRQLNFGDADSDGKPNIYLAGHYDEAIYDWEYNEGNPLLGESYTERVLFLDDTTDSFTPGNDQGKVRVAKLFPGDIDNDGQGDIVFTSASFAADKPHIYMIEHDGVLSTDKENTIIPNEFFIYQNHPNPFNPRTNIMIALNKSTAISLKIYDTMGRLVITLYDGLKTAGNHLFIWNGIDEQNNQVSSGVYFCTLTAGSSKLTKKMVLSK